MGNPSSPLNGQNQSLLYVLPDSGGNSGGPSGNGGYIPRGKGAYAPTGAADKTANTAVETHADGDTFASDPIEIVVAGVEAGGTTKALAVGSDGTLQAADPNQRQPAVFMSFSALSIASEADVWVPATGKKFRLLGFVITQNTAAGDIALKDGTAGTTILTVPATPIGQPLPFSLGGIGILSAAANNHLTATGVATETISGFVYGTEE
jgi:hypothetical protein